MILGAVAIFFLVIGYGVSGEMKYRMIAFFL
jgi:hypothetical protein